VVNHSLRSNREFRIGILLQYFLYVFIINSIDNLTLFFNVIVFYTVLSYSLQKVTHNKCAKYKFTIHPIGTHNNVL